MHGRHPSVPHSAAASILERIVDDPRHVAAALCQMATLAHASGRRQKRNQSVEVAAQLLGRRGRGPLGLAGIDRLPC
jgi:hypothetical protein